MDDRLAWSADAIVFAAIAGVGLFGLIILLVVDAVGDFDLPFLGGGFDNTPGVDIGPVAVNTQVLMGFLTGFGAGVWVATGYFDVPPVLAAAAGLIPGGIVAVIASLGYRAFKRSEATSSFSLQDTAGLRGTVTLAIMPDAPGRIFFMRGAEQHTALAVGEQSASTIAEGSTVEILGVSGRYIKVRPV